MILYNQELGVRIHSSTLEIDEYTVQLLQLIDKKTRIFSYDTKTFDDGI